MTKTYALFISSWTVEPHISPLRSPQRLLCGVESELCHKIKSTIPQYFIWKHMHQTRTKKFTRSKNVWKCFPTTPEQIWKGNRRRKKWWRIRERQSNICGNSGRHSFHGLGHSTYPQHALVSTQKAALESRDGDSLGLGRSRLFLPD